MEALTLQLMSDGNTVAGVFRRTASATLILGNVGAFYLRAWKLFKSRAWASANRLRISG